jgi:chromate reductase, NAD(P)H dehydrogenase (quinone)
MKVLGLSGSLRRESHNTQLLLAAARLFPADTEFEFFERLKEIPHYDEDDEPQPNDAVVALRGAIAEADAVLIATPEYNGTLPGHLKTAIDWASRPRGSAALANKPVAVIGGSTGMFGAVWAQADARKALATAGARVVDEEVPVPAVQEQVAEDGHLNEEAVHERLEAVLTALVDAVQEREEARAAA